MTEPSTGARLVPELLVVDINKSLLFWRDLCGFTVLFDRPDEGFAYLDLDGAQIMLDQIGQTRDWVTGPLKPPLGRGVNFQVSVTAIKPISAALARADWPCSWSRSRNGIAPERSNRSASIPGARPDQGQPGRR